MSRPMFTVVIPTIGRPSLPKTLRSIPGDVEVIVVADSYPLGYESYQDSRERVERTAAVAQDFGATFFEYNDARHDWGSPQLQYGYAHATGEWILNCGDDDVLEPLAFETIRRAIDSLPAPVPMMFRTALHPSPVRGNTNIAVLWQYPTLTDKNITGQCLVLPNDQARIGRWDILVDFGFITSTVELWGGRVEWRTEVISQCY